jgi:hypothetical protein
MGRVLLFAIPAQFGLRGVQIASAIIFILTIYFSYKILRHYNVKHAEWIIPVIGFQPVLFNISYTALAELPAAFLIVLSYYFFIKDKPLQTMIASSLIFLFRTEYFYAAGIFFLIYAYKKNYKVLPWILFGPSLWYVYTTLITLNPGQFFYDMTLHSRLPRIDAGVDWYYYLLHSGKIFGFLQMLFFVVAIFTLVIKKQIKEYWIPIVIAFLGLAIQTLFALKGFNITCSIGQLRYVAVVGPMIGIVSVYGLGKTLDIIKNKYLFVFLSVLIFAFMYIFGPYSTPWHSKFKIDQISEKISADAKENYKDYVVLSNMHQLANAMDEPSSGGNTYKNLTTTNLMKYDKAIIVWCRDLEGSPFVEENVTLSKVIANPGVELLREYKDTVNNSYSAPIYALRNRSFVTSDNKWTREVIDYLVHDQTTWETIDIRVYIKD